MTFIFRKTMSKRDRKTAANTLDKRALVAAQQAMAMKEAAVALRILPLYNVHAAMVRALKLNDVAGPLDTRIAQLLFREKE